MSLTFLPEINACSTIPVMFWICNLCYMSPTCVTSLVVWRRHHWDRTPCIRVSNPQSTEPIHQIRAISVSVERSEWFSSPSVRPGRLQPYLIRLFHTKRVNWPSLSGLRTQRGHFHKKHQKSAINGFSFPKKMKNKNLTLPKI